MDEQTHIFAEDFMPFMHFKSSPLRSPEEARRRRREAHVWRYRLGHTNIHGLTQNCYFCTVAAIAGVTTDQLVEQTGMMQQQTANTDHIQQLFVAAHVSDGTFIRYLLEQDVRAYLGLLRGRMFGFGYRRVDGTAHMVVGMNIDGAIYLVDYQSNPPLVSMQFPSTAVSFELYPTPVNVPVDKRIAVTRAQQGTIA